MNRLVLGLMLVILYCIVTALSTVVVSASEKMYGPLLITFSSATVTIFWFNSLQLRSLYRLRKVYKNHGRLIVLLNISTAVMWIGTFIALNVLNPDVFTAFFLGGLPVFIFLINWPSLVWNTRTRIELIFTIAIAGLLFLIGCHVLDVSDGSIHIIHGMLISIVASFFAAWTIILSHKLAHAGVSTTETLSQRFYALWLVSGIALCVFPAALPASVVIHYIPIAIVVAILSFILPLFLLQKGIERVDPMFVSFLSPLIPVIAFSLEMLSDRYVFDPIELCLLIALAMVIIAATIVKVLDKGSSSK